MSQQPYEDAETVPHDDEHMQKLGVSIPQADEPQGWTHACWT